MGSKNLSYSKAIEIVLSALKRPLSMFEIEREIVRRELLEKINSSMIRHTIYKDLEKGDASVFAQIEYNLYTLRTSEVVTETNFPAVLVFDANKFEGLGYFHGVNKEFQSYFDEILRTDNPIFIPRVQAEGNPNYKQVVSYALITYKKKLLRFTRHEYKRNRNLDLIDGKYSLGFGGHVQAEDLNLFTVDYKDSGYTASLFRELREEIGIQKQDIKEIRTIGVLNDDSTPKGKCHFAFLHLVELANPNFEDIEKWVIKPELVSFEQIVQEFENYEYWSKLCLQHYYAKELQNLEFTCFIDNRRGLSLKNLSCIAIVGEIGSGKSEVCSILEKQFGYVRIPCSKILREMLQWKSQTGDERHELQNAGLEFINKRGAHKRFAKKIVEYIKSEASDKPVIIDGLRYRDTYFELRRALGTNKIPVIYIESNRDNQYRNFIARDKTKVGLGKFTEIVDHPVESHIGQFLEYADILIFNFGSLESLVEKVGDYLQKEPSDAFLIDAWDSIANFRHKQILDGNDITFESILMPYIINSLKRQPKYPSLKVLDVGCGTGVLTNAMANHAKHITAIDQSGVSIRTAKKYTKKKNITFQCESIEDFLIEDNFDAVIANMTFHSVENIETALKSIYTSLRPKGVLIFSLPHPRYYPERERLRDLFNATGYEYTKLSFHKIPFTISLDPEPLPGFIPYFHRPISYYETLLSKTGFWLVELSAPIPDKELMRRYQNSWSAPHILLGTAMKP